MEYEYVYVIEKTVYNKIDGKMVDNILDWRIMYIFKSEFWANQKFESLKYNLDATEIPSPLKHRRGMMYESNVDVTFIELHVFPLDSRSA